MKNENLRAVLGIVLALALVFVIGCILKLTNNIQSGGVMGNMGFESSILLIVENADRGDRGSSPLLTTRKERQLCQTTFQTYTKQLTAWKDKLFLLILKPMYNFWYKIQYRLPRMFDILMDRSEQLKDNPSYRFQIIKSIWNEKVYK